jgi:outer membrane lipoprotein SlyB
MASMEELLRYLESFMHGQINQGQPPQGQQPSFGGQPAGFPPPGEIQGGVATNPLAQPPSELAAASPAELQLALQQFTELHPELAPYLALAGNEPPSLAGAVGQLAGIPSEALGGYVPAFDQTEGSGEHEISARIAEAPGSRPAASPGGSAAPSSPAADVTQQVIDAKSQASNQSDKSWDEYVAQGAGQPGDATLASAPDAAPSGSFLGVPANTDFDPINFGGTGDAGNDAFTNASIYSELAASDIATAMGVDTATAATIGAVVGDVGRDAGYVVGTAFGDLNPFGASGDSGIVPPESSAPTLGEGFASDPGPVASTGWDPYAALQTAPVASTGWDPYAALQTAPVASNPVNVPQSDTGPLGGGGVVPAGPINEGDGQSSGTSRVTVEPTFVEGDPIGGDAQPPMTISGGGPAIDDGASTGWSDALSDGVGSVGDDLDSGIDLSGVNDLVGDVTGSGVPLGAAAGAASDLAHGNYTGAAEEGVIGGLDVGADALGLPGVDGDISVFKDLVDGNTGAIAGDAESAAISTAAGAVGAAAGSVLGPVGTLAGAAIGGFVGRAVAPAAEHAVSDTFDTGRAIFNDTTSSLTDAATALQEGNVVGAVADVGSGAIADAGDVATGTVDLVGDSAEGVEDVASASAGVAEDAASGIEDGLSDIGSIF